MNIIELDDRDTTVLVVDHICAAYVYDTNNHTNGYKLSVLMINNSSEMIHYYDDKKTRDLDYSMLKKKMKAVDIRPRIDVHLPHGFGPR